ncbi:MAG: hypothetical protein A2X94_00805 [Bdellovibrionales bacterium GWB1_55_8]|nr:MAG: hypothetical protein A2X94_00805 [Bdellovibrionales bacterium GWB1_55_8]
MVDPRGFATQSERLVASGSQGTTSSPRGIAWVAELMGQVKAAQVSSRSYNIRIISADPSGSIQRAPGYAFQDGRFRHIPARIYAYLAPNETLDSSIMRQSSVL